MGFLISCNKITDQGVDLFTASVGNSVTAVRRLALDFT